MSSLSECNKRPWTYNGWPGFSDISTVNQYRDRLDEYSRFIDTTLALFKGELSLQDIVDMPFKKLVSLREARVKRLLDEAKQSQKEADATESQQIRDRILMK